MRSRLIVFGLLGASMLTHVAMATDRGPPADVVAVKQVLAQYQRAVEKLDLAGTEALFTSDSRVFESGGDEGSYAHYLTHHLVPELAEFRSFRFSNYKVEVRAEGPFAVAAETYDYRIQPKSGSGAERKGVATSVLRKEGGQWRIVSSHNSSRRPKP